MTSSRTALFFLSILLLFWSGCDSIYSYDPGAKRSPEDAAVEGNTNTIILVDGSLKDALSDADSSDDLPVPPDAGEACLTQRNLWGCTLAKESHCVAFCDQLTINCNRMTCSCINQENGASAVCPHNKGLSGLSCDKAESACFFALDTDCCDGAW